jgi:predicted nucleotidyltransferase
MNIVERNIDRLIELCKNHKVSELYIFGSILTEKFSDKSDIDFLVQFEKIYILKYFDNYMDFKENLEKLLDRPVDLLENQAIRNPVFRKVVDRDKKLVYEREST